MGSLATSDDIRVRRATLRDLDVLVHQRRAMWEDMGISDRSDLDEADRVYKRWARTRLKNGNLLAWVAETRRGMIVGGGCLWLQPVQPQPRFEEMAQPYLMSMYTEPKFRWKGVASRIVEQAVKWSKNNGYHWVILHASRMGRRLYRKHGFRRIWEMELEFTSYQLRRKRALGSV